ncbi:RecQ family ATP-dependent DNA helicase [Oceanicella actignis]|uniref:DNA 3'-5' helicase n=1 Tax=Oceanicella actignis TaxID=1189325 RepID=A0A1M7U557_9RHOB|nr:RecQ family ATP-dependent DNA helicase [Oceanicella actignis]SET87897.1 ATP-dependent DNA helicase, RecQ-like [Oceanicella actignis]SHN78108.1 ATP-dependent DNA helicase RecQ [Oceanicella actignis]
MTDRTAALKLLRIALGEGTAEFREGQWEAIDALVNRRERLLVVQRTGWGKSSVYFIATSILRDSGRGPTLIVSPLIALMRNQIEAAERLGIRAYTINSTNRADWPAIERAVRRNEVDALLVSPERLANDEFVEKVLLPIAERIGLLVVDEAHCISDWGHDFRPDYRRLANILRRMPANVPILGTTATANNRVVEDVRNQLGDIGIQRGSLMRSTLALQTVQLPTQAARLAWLAEHIGALPGTGIVYTLTKRDAKQVADWLQSHGINARAYFSGVVADGFEDSDAYRQHLERKLLNNEIKALVATTALGMGYDKPDLGFVVHYQAPGSIIAYYQQVGRAGRAIDHAIGVLMSGEEDSHIHDYFRKSAFPKDKWIGAILEALEESDGLSVLQLEKAVNLRRGQIEQVLKFLSVENPAPVLKSGSTWQRTPVPYRMDHEKIERLTGQRETEWQEVQRYVATDGCLMEFLSKALDDEDPQPCGKCDRCLGRPIVDPQFTREMAISAARYLRHAELELECNKQVAKDAFPIYGLRGNLPTKLRAETGRILSRWGDAGWGQLVAEDKHNGRFRDELVHAVVEMLNERWRPTPRPAWVTCVPSLNNPTLVPDFARRLAEALGVPFKPVIKKVKENEPQKFQQNRFHQCRNLDGAFKIDGTVPREPVLLVDDVVDSAWTLTIVAALLRHAGSGPVWPFALTTSSIGA